MSQTDPAPHEQRRIGSNTLLSPLGPWTRASAVYEGMCMYQGMKGKRSYAHITDIAAKSIATVHLPQDRWASSTNVYAGLTI